MIVKLVGFLAHRGRTKALRGKSTFIIVVAIILFFHTNSGVRGNLNSMLSAPFKAMYRSEWCFMPLLLTGIVSRISCVSVQSRLGNKPIITSANKHISGSFNAIHPDLKATAGVLSKTLSI